MLLRRSFFAPLGWALGLLPVFAGRDASAAPGAFSGSESQSFCESHLLADAADGQLDEHSFLRAALIAGGEQDPLLWSRCEATVTRLVAELRAGDTLAGPAGDQARAVHRFLHQKVLTGGYDPAANRLSQVLDDGKFNCITASTLFMVVAGECGWQTAARELPDHVLVVFDPQGIALPVEMTAPTWREAPNGGRDIGPAQVLATYYHNRGVAHLAASDFAAAVLANGAALELDGACAAARQNLLAAWNNWALTLASAGDYEAALEKIDAGLAQTPDCQALLDNRDYIQARQRGDHDPTHHSG